jgi:DNA-binding transcriptional LysR family regulator
MYLSLSKLRTFVSVAQHRSFRKASEELHLSQPALSVHIRNLEEMLQIPLFHRTTRSVTLTDEGERFLIRARRALEELECGLIEIRDQAALLRGRVVVSCLPSIAYYALPPIIASFVKKHSEIEVQVFDELNVSLLQRVLSREADFGIGPYPEQNEDLQFTPILRDPFVAIVHDEHPLALRSEVRLKALLRFPIITLAQGTAVRSKLDRIFEEEGLVLKPAYETLHRATLCGMAQAGLGVAILPAMIQSMMNNSSLRSVKIVGPDIAREFGIIERRDQAQRPAVRAFISALQETLMTSDQLKGDAVRKTRGNRRAGLK